jgi:hypothetical protein
MNKTQLIDAVAEKANLTKREARIAVTVVLDEMNTAPAKKAPGKKATGKKATGKKAPGKKAPGKKAPANKAPDTQPSSQVRSGFRRKGWPI